MLQLVVEWVERRRVVAEVLSITHQVEVGVYVLTDIIRNVLDKQRSQMHGLVGGAGHAERPLQVVVIQLLEAFAFGQQRTVGDARCQRVILSTQKTFHRLDNPSL